MALSITTSFESMLPRERTSDQWSKSLSISEYILDNGFHLNTFKISTGRGVTNPLYFIKFFKFIYLIKVGNIPRLQRYTCLTVSILPYTHRHCVLNTEITLCHQTFNFGTGAANRFKKIKLLHCIGLVIYYLICYTASIHCILIAVVEHPLQYYSMKNIQAFLI